MKRLLAIAVIGDWVGDWYRVRGDEREAIACPVSDGEKILLEIEKDGTTETVLLSTKRTMLQIDGWLRYRVVKKGNGVAEPSHTTVELITYGSPLSRSSNSDHPQRDSTVGGD